MKHLPAFIAIGFFILSCVGTVKSNSTLTVVDSVDLQRYLARWYEIASYPAWFQKGCTGSTAEYSLLPDGKIQVINRCRKDNLDGPLKESKGKAEVVDTATKAKLKVWFFLALQRQLLDHRPRSRLSMGRGGGALPKILVDSQP